MTESCCHSQDASRNRFDGLLWGSLAVVGVFYGLSWVMSGHGYAAHFAASVRELMHAMWWGMVAGALFVGLMGRVPREFITKMLGRGGTATGILRAALAGTLLDLCSHGILMVGMKLYERGASIGQVMTFLIASPWNSLSLTLIMVGLIGLPWTLAFIALSMLVGIVTGLAFDALVARGALPANPNRSDIPAEFAFWKEARAQLAGVRPTPALAGVVLWEGVLGSRMVLRWMLFGVILASAVRTFLPLDYFQTWFGPSLAGLGMTLVAATVMEVCSEGSTPMAADLLTRAHAPGNSFAFLMTGVATDYTEVMSIKDTTKSWRIALFLPLITVPQVVILGWILNQGGLAW